MWSSLYEPNTNELYLSTVALTVRRSTDLLCCMRQAKAHPPNESLVCSLPCLAAFSLPLPMLAAFHARHHHFRHPQPPALPPPPEPPPPRLWQILPGLGEGSVRLHSDAGCPFPRARSTLKFPQVAARTRNREEPAGSDHSPRSINSVWHGS